MQSNISQQFSKALDDLQQWKNSFGAFSLDESLQVYPDTSAKVFNELIDRLKGNFPFTILCTRGRCSKVRTTLRGLHMLQPAPSILTIMLWMADLLLPKWKRKSCRCWQSFLATGIPFRTSNLKWYYRQSGSPLDCSQTSSSQKDSILIQCTLHSWTYVRSTWNRIRNHSYHTGWQV